MSAKTVGNTVCPVCLKLLERPFAVAFGQRLCCVPGLPVLESWVRKYQVVLSSWFFPCAGGDLFD